MPRSLSLNCNYQRARAMQELAKPDKPLAEARDAFLEWIGDRSRNVRDAALAGLHKCEVTAADAPKLKVLLTRSAGDLRRGVLGLPAKQAVTAALASADRLLVAGSVPQRLAGFALPTLCLETFWASEAALSLASLTYNLTVPVNDIYYSSAGSLVVARGGPLSTASGLATKGNHPHAAFLAVRHGGRD